MAGRESSGIMALRGKYGRATMLLVAFVLTLFGVNLWSGAEGASGVVAAAQVLDEKKEAHHEFSEGAVYIEVESISPKRPFWVAIHFAPEAGWYTLWKDQLDSAAEFDWLLPEGFTLGKTLWPTPEFFFSEKNDSMLYGFRGTTMVLQEIHPPKHLEDFAFFHFELDAIWPVCREDCFYDPAEYRFDLISGDGARNPDNNFIFEQARKRVPVPSPWPVRLESDETGFELQIYIEPAEKEQVRGLRYFALIRGQYLGDEPLDGIANWEGYSFQAPRSANQAELERGEGVIVIEFESDESAYGLYKGFYVSTPNRLTAIGSLTAPAVSERGTSFGMGLGLAMLFAFLGGLILNLMPCVFPVLAIKVFAVVQAGTGSRRKLRMDAIYYTIGILVSFLVVAAILIAVRGFGQQAGWGFQLQSPIFVLSLILLLFLVGLNFSGLYEIPARIQQLGQKLAQDEGAAGAFSTGVLATIVATPCTAPFMGAAIGYALMQSPSTGFLVFESLGLGLATPFLVMSFVPALYKRLPKAGPWMVKFKQFLAFPIYATVLWLLWVLAQQSGTEGALIALVIISGLALFIWLADRSKILSRPIRSAVLTLFLILFGAGGWFGSTVISERAEAMARETAVMRGNAVAYSELALVALRRQGQPVFLNVTAAWCITCIIQEQLVFASDRFKNYIKEKGITYMVADWTQPDEEIERLLARFGRSGIPFYAFYPSDPVARPVVLPAILTTDMVLSLMEENN